MLRPRDLYSQHPTISSRSGIQQQNLNVGPKRAVDRATVTAGKPAPALSRSDPNALLLTVKRIWLRDLGALAHERFRCSFRRSQGELAFSRHWLISAIPGISLPEVRQRIRQSGAKGRSRYDWRSVSSVRVCCGDLRALVAALSARYLWRCNVDPMPPVVFAFPRDFHVYPHGRPRSGAG